VRPVRAALLRACIVTVAAACAISVTPLSAAAAPLTEAPAAAAPEAAAAAAPEVGTGAIEPFEGILFEHGDRVPQEYYRIVPDWNTGLAMIQNGRGTCLTSGPHSGPRQEHQPVDRTTCRANDADQQFYFVPQNHNPRSTPDTGKGDQYFYIVSSATDDCIWSGSNGLEFGSDDFSQQAHMWRCAEGDPGQEWVFRNEIREDGRAYRWSQLLALATVHSTNRCLDRPGACQVSPDSGPFAGQWFESADPDVSLLGTVSTVSQGCGSGDSGAVINKGSSSDPTTVSGTVSVAKSVSVSLALNESTKAVAETGVKDIWGAELSASFSIGEQIAQTIGETKSVTRSISAVIPAGEALMGQYSQRDYTFSGAWQMDIGHPRVAGSLAWSVPARTSLPVILDGADPTTYTPVGSKTPKDCTASSAARNTAAPVITNNPSTCATTPSAPTGAVNEVLSVCPGTWDLGGTTAPAVYSYEWYLTQGGSDGIHPVAGSVGAGQIFTIRQSTAPGTTPTYLGVRISEVGSTMRYDSAPAVAANPVLLASTVTPPSGAPEAPVTRTSFTSVLPTGVAGEPYSANVVADPAAGVDVVVAPGSVLPEGLTLSSTGVLSGTPADNGIHDLQLLDGSAATPETSTVRLAIEAPATEFTEVTSLTGTVGTALDTALVTTAPDDLALEVEGGLPYGLQIDPSTGVLSGTPGEAGRFEFVLDNGDANVGRPTGFVLEVSPSAAVFSDADPAAARVGSPYTFSVLASAGSHTALALEGTGNLPEGLELNSATGEISGTPTTVGRHTVTLIDTTSPEPVERTVEFVVGAAAAPGPDAGTPDPAGPGQPSGSGSSPAGSGGALAATGADAASLIAPGIAGALALAAGLSALIIRRRRSVTR
jgi:hypothetical protein